MHNSFSGAAGHPERLSAEAKRYLDDPANELIFSAASLWEITIKASLGRDDFRVDPRRLRLALLAHGYIELPVTSEHAVHLDALSPLHKDPFDRLLVAQALAEGVTLLTADAQVAEYAGCVRKV